ncbi:MAG: diaminopimelate epimerase [Acidobacteriota bacterium]
MTAFYKLSGAGNDFIAFVEPASDPGGGSIRAWCRRGLSLGADGVVVLERGASAGSVTMRHWNADGGRAELCLNGSRCAVRLADELGWIDGPTVNLTTDSGVLRGRTAGPDRVEIEVPFAVEAPREVALETSGGLFRGHALRVGVPHLVVPSPGPVSEVEFAAVAPELRAHPELGPAGANVNLVERLAGGGLAVRTWERGVEAETLACGTGAVASVFVGASVDGLEMPAEVSTAGGFVLGVSRLGQGAALTGDARIVARGELLPGAVG